MLESVSSTKQELDATWSFVLWRGDVVIFGMGLEFGSIFDYCRELGVFEEEEVQWNLSQCRAGWLDVLVMENFEC